MKALIIVVLVGLTLFFASVFGVKGEGLLVGRDERIQSVILNATR